MQFATVRPATKGSAGTHAAVADDAGWLLLDAPDLSALLAAAGWRDLIDAALASDAARHDPADLVFLNPLPRPAKILCCGLNYRDHIQETGRDLPEHPTLFAKFADTLTDPGADILVHGSESVDWEAELAVVVGERLHRADREQAAAGILGYTVANDVSMRDWQYRTLQWLQGKAFDRTTPLGPVVVTADAIDPVGGLEVTCLVDGERMQSGNTRELVFDAAHLLSYISQFTALSPGDLVLTGTPGGVGTGMEPPRFLHDGEVVTTAIEGIGELRNTIRMGAARR